MTDSNGSFTNPQPAPGTGALEAATREHGRAEPHGPIPPLRREPTGDALPADTSLQGGALVLHEVISQSHFGITYRGLDAHLQRPVAVKEFFPDACTRVEQSVMPHGTLSPEAFARARDRFLDEARVLARFRHPNIVHVYAFFEENNTAYMVMEYIEGETLLERIGRLGRLPESEAIDYILQIGEALEEVHSRHLLHCDVKPDNIILCSTSSRLAPASMKPGDAAIRRRVVLVDFGLSTQLEDRGNYLTRPLSEAGHFGTPGYAPLEQYTQNVEFGMYTDVYGLGATLYHLLTGRIPTPSADRAYGVEVETPEQVNEAITPAISNAVMWALQLRAGQRPQTIADFTDQLRAAMTRPAPSPPTAIEAVGIVPVSIASPPATSPATGPLPSVAGQGQEEQGCLEVAFAGCMTLWAAALIMYLIGLLIHAIMLGGH